jgi:hypothetical protein
MSVLAVCSCFGQYIGKSKQHPVRQKLLTEEADAVNPIWSKGTEAKNPKMEVYT